MPIFLIFVFAVFLIRFLFSTYIPLIDDEAYHWSWSWNDNLSLSYFDHPGLIAWLERLSTFTFGESYFAIRLPSFICFSLATYILYKLAQELYNTQVAKVFVVLFLSIPFFGLGGLVASPEPPFALAWALGLYVFYKGYSEKSDQYSIWKTWILLGLIMGFGLNSKFIIAMLAFGFATYFIFTPHRRKDLLHPAPWTGILIASLLCSPIFIWNIQNDWPGFKYQFHDRHTGAEHSFSRWVQWFAAQFIFYTPPGFVLIWLAFFKNIKNIKNNIPARFLIAMALPSLIIFYPQPYFAEHKPHWSGAAIMTLLILAASFFTSFTEKKKKIWITAFAIILIPLNLLVYTPFLGPWIPKAYRLITQKQDFNPRWDLTNEFYGWEELGKYVAQKKIELETQTQNSYFLAAHRYENTAQLTWGAKLPVIMLSSTVSHYTVKQKSKGLIEALKGSNTLFVESEKYRANPMEWAKFDSCESEKFETFRGIEKAREFTIWNCKNFQGITK